MANVTIPEPSVFVVDKVEPRHFQVLFQSITDIIQKVNGKLSLGDGTEGKVSGNLDSEAVSVYFPAADTATPIKHKLGRVPIGFIVILPSEACIVYAPSTASWTTTTARFWCDTAQATVKLLLF